MSITGGISHFVADELRSMAGCSPYVALMGPPSSHRAHFFLSFFLLPVRVTSLSAAPLKYIQTCTESVQVSITGRSCTAHARIIGSPHGWRERGTFRVAQFQPHSTAQRKGPQPEKNVFLHLKRKSTHALNKAHTPLNPIGILHHSEGVHNKLLKYKLLP